MIPQVSWDTAQIMVWAQCGKSQPAVYLWQTLVLAMRCKCPEKRLPNQKTATLKVLCANPKTTNFFIIGHIHIDNHLVNTCKDIMLLIRCVKCQEYDHTCDSCIGVEKCANCSNVSHSSLLCSNKWALSCMSCRAGLVHASSSPKFPVFIKKCAAPYHRKHHAIFPD